MHQLQKNEIEIHFETVLEVKKKEELVYIKTDSEEYQTTSDLL